MLWQRKQNWYYFDTGLMGRHHKDADFLKKWYYQKSINGEIASYFEVIDLQRYKVISKPQKVQVALREKRNTAFIFFACLN